MKSILLLLITTYISLTGCSQSNTSDGRQLKNKVQVGGRCEGCEGIYESPIPFEKLKNIDTLPDFYEAGPKIEISGIIYQQDGKTPAKDVILYIYHTDQKGVYPKKGIAKGWGKRHGYIRGWLKTDKNGFYKFYTLIPASYPNSTNPKHIHPTIKEPGFNEYWIDDFVFDDDTLLPDKERNKRDPVAGSGLLKPVLKDGILRATRDIVLGLNVKDYPNK